LTRVLRAPKPGSPAISEEPDYWDMQRIDIKSRHDNLTAGIALQLVIFGSLLLTEKILKTDLRRRTLWGKS
jgi:hypothetical protein